MKNLFDYLRIRFAGLLHHGRHVWHVPDLAFFAGQQENLFAAHCDCGSKRVRSGTYWSRARCMCEVRPVAPETMA